MTFFRFTPFGMKHLLEENGFEILAAESIGGIETLILDIAAKFFINISLGTPIDRISKYISKILSKKPHAVKFEASKIRATERWSVGYVFLARRIS